MIILSIWSYRYFKKTYDGYLSEKSTKKAVEQYKKEVDIRRKKEEELKKINEIKDSIINLNQMLLKENDIQRYFDFILKKAIEIIPKAETGIIFSLEKGSLKVVSEEGYGMEILDKTIALNEKIKNRIRNTKQSVPIIFNRMGEVYAKGYKMENFKNNKGIEINSFASIPLYNASEFFGYMNLKSSSENAFDDYDREMMIFIAEHIDLALKICKQYEKLKYFSKYDQLTGFYNRWHLNYIKETEVKRWKRLNISITVMVLDFDNLKKINDEYGHTEGDKFFEVFAESVRNTFRSTDIFIRLGGDEFLMIFFEMPSAELERIVETVKEEVKIKKDENDVSFELRDFSFGISVIGEDSDDFDELVKIADNRMYTIKKDKNRKNTEL